MKMPFDRKMIRFMPRHRQRGAVLILAMLVIVVLTILGISAMGTGGLELKMANNSLNQVMSFNKAEDLRAAAEEDVNGIVDAIEGSSAATFASVTSGAGNGYYDLSDNQTPPGVDTTGFWADSGNYKQVAGLPGGYAIEYLGVRPVYLDRLTAASDGDEELMHFFRITVFGAGNDNARTAVQAIYMRN
jgi:type IV pilus assembly protein PilX